MQQIKNISKDLKIAIYGAGLVGLLVKHYIEKNRPDLKIVCFFDKLIKGEVEGIAVRSIKTIQEFKGEFDLIFIGSYSNIPIMETILRHYGINNYMHFVNFSPDATEEVGLVEDDNKFEDFVRVEEVQKILSSPESKKIFELIVHAYNCKPCFKKLANYLAEQNKKIFPHMREQYLDFIDKDSIKTVISGGAYDAGTSLLFLDRLKNVEKIYAFEPMYEKFKCEVNDSIITESGKVEVIEKGLFQNSGELNFSEQNSASMVNINPKFSHLVTSHVIKTVSIDDFVKENNIKKIDFIKMDVEGCELPALKGAQNTITNHRPQLAICIYHSYNELFDIPIYLNNLLQGYKFEIYHYSLNSICESVLYGIPDEAKSKM